MALVIANRVQETTTTIGTGTVTLAGAVANFQSFAVVGNGNTTYYTITSGTDWEVGIGTYSTTGPTLARTTILSSSAAGAAITLVGTSTVFSSYPAEKVISDGYGLLPVANGGTGATTLTANNVLLGNGTSAVQVVAPGTNGNVLTSNGTAWTSAAMAAGITFTNVKTSNYTAAVNDGVQTDTTAGSFTVTLPATPATGAQVIITDAGNAWGTNNLTVGRNGSTIEGVASDLICNISSVAVQLVYSGTTWTVFAQAGGAGGVIDINIQTTGTLTVSRGGTGATTLTGVVKGTGTSALTAGTVALGSEVSGTLPVGNGGTGAATLTANNVLLGNGASALQVVAPGTSGNVLTSDGTTWASTAAPSSAVQYPQNSQSANYTLVLGDAGKQIFHPVSDATTRTFTIPSNASVAFPIGTVVLFTVENSGRYVTVAITSDTLVFGSGTTGSLIVAANNTLMCIKVTATKWMANYLYQTGSPATLAQTLAVAHDTSPFISAYPWSASGFGVKLANPATLPTGFGYGVAFSPSGDAIAVGHDVTPRISAYPWSGSGFGTKFANPVTVPTEVSFAVAFSPAGDAIAAGHFNSPYVSAYPWSGSGFGTKFANPATLPTGTGRAVAFSPSGNAIAVGHDGSPRISAYPWSGSGFGTKFANPASLPPDTCYGVAFNPAGDTIAVAHGTSPYVSAYPWSGSGFGTKFANPATLPTGIGYGVAFSPAGDAIAVAHFTTPFITAYPWSGSGFGTKFANPATLPTGYGNNVAFSPVGDAIAVAHGNSPYVSAYPWNGSGFGTKFANPATLPTGTGNDIALTINP